MVTALGHIPLLTDSESFSSFQNLLLKGKKKGMGGGEKELFTELGLALKL